MERSISSEGETLRSWEEVFSDRGEEGVTYPLEETLVKSEGESPSLPRKMEK